MTEIRVYHRIPARFDRKPP